MRILIILSISILLVFTKHIHSNENEESAEKKFNEINSLVSGKMLSRYNLFMKILETEDESEKKKLIDEFLLPIIDKNMFNGKRAGVQTRWGKRSDEYIKRYLPQTRWG